MVNEYASVGGGGPSAGYSGAAESGSAPPGVAGGASIGSGSSSVGSVAWYQQEISAREQAARASTVDNPSVSVGASQQPYTDPITGMKFATEQIARDLGYGSLQSGPGSLQSSQAPAQQQLQPPNQALIQQISKLPYYIPQSQIGDTKTQALIAQGKNPLQALSEQIRTAETTPGLTDDRYYANEFQKATMSIYAGEAGYHALGQKSGLPMAPNPFEYTGDLAIGLLKGTQGKSGAQAMTPVDLSILGLPSGKGLQDVAFDRALGKETVSYDQFAPAVNVISRAMATGEMGPYGELKTYSSAVNRELTLPEQQLIGYTAGMTAQRLGLGWDIIPELLVSPSDVKAAAKELGYGRPYTEMVVPPSIASGGGGGEGTVGPITNVQTKQFPTNLPTPFKSEVTTPQEYPNAMRSFTSIKMVEQPKGEIPWIGVVPIISPIVALFQPGKETTYSKTFGTEPTTITKTAVTTQSVIEQSYNKLEKGAVAVLWGGSPPSVSTQDIKSLSPIAAAIPGLGSFMSSSLINPLTSEYSAEYIKGEITGTVEKPIASAVSFGSAFAVGGVLRGLSAGAEYGRIATAEKLISSPRLYRPIESIASTVTSTGPKVLGSLYFTDVGFRTTEYGKDISPAAAGRLGAIAATEIRPAIAGGYLGYSIPEIYGTAKIGYKASLQEGTLSRIKTAPSNIISKFKLEYPQFVEESYGSRVMGSVRYAGYKLGMETPVTGEQSTLNIGTIPAKYTGYSGPTTFEPDVNMVAYGKQPTVFESLGVGKSVIEEPRGIRPLGDIDTSFVYGRSPTLFDVMGVGKTPPSETVRPTMREGMGSTISGYSDEWTTLASKAYPEASEPLSIKIKAGIQESKFVENLKTNLIRPSEEIYRLNVLGKQISDIRISPTKSKPMVVRPVDQPAPRSQYTPSKQEPSKKEIGVSGTQYPQQLIYSMEPQTGVPEYPGMFGRSRKYTLEEELQYLTLPPGFVQPGPSRKTDTSYTFVPITDQVLGSDISTRTALKTQYDASKLSELNRGYVTPDAYRYSVVSPASGMKRDQEYVTKPVVTPTFTVIQQPAIGTALTPGTITTQEPALIPPPVLPSHVPTPPITLPPGLPPAFDFGGGGAASASRRGKRLFIEFFPIGLDISTFGGRTKYPSKRKSPSPKKSKKTKKR